MSFRVLLATLSCYGVVTRSQAGDIEVLNDWVRNKLPAAQRPILKIDADCRRTTSRIESTELRDGKTAGCTLHVAEKFCGANGLREATESDVRPAGAKTYNHIACFGKNSGYYFELEPSKRPGAWLLSKILPREGLAESMLAEGRPTDQLAVEPGSGTDALLKCRFAGIKVSSKNVAKLPGFVLQSAKPTPTGDAIDVAFTFTPAAVVHPQRADVACTVRYDLSAFGTPVEWTEASGPPTNPGLRRYAIRLGRVDDRGCEYVFEHSITSHLNGKLLYSSQSKAQVSTVFGDVPESEFLLAAYGLPEPPGFEPKRTPLYLWLLAGAGAAFVLAVAFRTLARRRTPS